MSMTRKKILERLGLLGGKRGGFLGQTERDHHKRGRFINLIII